MIFVHGSMDRQAAFAKVLKHLPDVECVVYDRRGYAASSHVGEPFDVDAHVTDLELVVDAVGEGRRSIVLVGHSFGGVVSLALAARRPEKVAAVAVYESPMSWESWWSSTSGGAQAVRTGHDPELAAENFLKRFIGDERWNGLSEAVRNRRRREGRVLVAELADIRAVRPYVLENVKCPIVSAVGTRAPDHMRRGARLLAEVGSPIDLVVIDGAHHNAPMSHPGEFAERVVRPAVALAVTSD